MEWESFSDSPFLIVAYLYDTKIEKGQNRFLSARPFLQIQERKKKKKKKKRRGEERRKRTDHLILFLFTFILIIQYMYVLGGPVAKSADISLPHFFFFFFFLRPKPFYFGQALAGPHILQIQERFSLKKKKKKKKKKGEEEAYGPSNRISIHIYTYHSIHVLGGPVAKSADILLPHFIIRSSHRYA